MRSPLLHCGWQSLTLRKEKSPGIKDLSHENRRRVYVARAIWLDSCPQAHGHHQGRHRPASTSPASQQLKWGHTHVNLQETVEETPEAQAFLSPTEHLRCPSTSQLCRRLVSRKTVFAFYSPSVSNSILWMVGTWLLPWGIPARQFDNF